MKLSVAKLDGVSGTERGEWTGLAARCNGGEVYGLPSWAVAIVGAYGLGAYLLTARGGGARRPDTSESSVVDAKSVGRSIEAGLSKLEGVLPLVWVRHRLFGNSLVSLPFCDSGGGLLGGAQTESALLEKACDLADELGVPTIDVRRQRPLESIGTVEHWDCAFHEVRDGLLWKRGWEFRAECAQSKVRMLLTLPDDPDALMRSFKSKLRSQIQKPIKGGLKVRTGRQELVEDFYRVFAENMRDIGSPVHSRGFVEEVVAQYGDAAGIFVVYLKDAAVAASLTLGFRDVLSNPWASALRRYSNLAPNMLLYWSMLEYACQNRYRMFDFGRSTVGEGTYRFKEQWGARPVPLYWYRFTHGKVKSRPSDRYTGGMSRAIEIWKRLPIPVTRILGPRIRRHISL